MQASSQHITVDIQGEQLIRFPFVYAKCSRAERQVLWSQLQQLSSIETPWLVGGDFNTILRPSEKRGGLAPDYGSIQDFHECMLGSNLSEIGFEGNESTWCNNQHGRNRIWQRLDRILGNGEAFLQFPELQVKHLQRLISDHSPLLLSLTAQTPYRSKFTFQRMWLEHPDFQNLVEQTWGEPVSGTPSSKVAEKLRRLKLKLKQWNWSVFGDVKTRVVQLQNQVSEIENRLQSNWNEADDTALQICNKDLKQVLSWEADLLFQKPMDLRLLSRLSSPFLN